MRVSIYPPFMILCAAFLISACTHQPAGNKANKSHTDEQAALLTLAEYADRTYGNQLSLTADELKQLTWVLDNPIATPEMASKKTAPAIHIEIKRAMARLYCLQLLRDGSEGSYQRFIAPQITGQNGPVLSKDSFTTLSTLIRQFNTAAYETLKAASIISAITLSPTAKKRAEQVLQTTPPSDSVQFLTETAPYADKIYPLAHAVIKKYPNARQLFETTFMPESHLRHMMYNEGSLSMYSHILKGIANQSIHQSTLDLWYAYWLVNIAGFRGHINPNGSLYLSQNTYRAMNELRGIFNKRLQGESLNPMTAYLKKRAEWLGLPQLTVNPQVQIALGSLGACLRLFTHDEGKALFAGVKQLDTRVRNQWLTYAEEQLTEQPYPAETYAPTVFANTKEKEGLTESLVIVMPLYVSVLTTERTMRAAQPPLLKSTTPVSFRKLARPETIDMLIQSQSNTYPININPIDGTADIITH